MIDRNHPAVEALARELAQLEAGEPWPSNDDLGGHRTLGTRDDEYRFAMLEEARAVLNTTIPHLESATEDNLARLRDTPAGKQLMAEGWDERHKARPDYSQGHDDDCMGWEDCCCGRYVNPYRP